MIFKDDLELGKKVEHIICSQIIKKKYPKSYVVEGYKKEYDIVVPEKNYTIEVKYDKMSYDTGNYMIETSYGGVPSGISTTKADWWIQVDNNKSIWIPTESLRYILNEYKEISMNGIDLSKSKTGYLVPAGKLIYSAYAKTIFHSSKVIDLIQKL
jgi:hypothetical protein